MDKTNEIKIYSDYITLQQLLKLADLIGSGGSAKGFLAENKVLVNDVEDNRRGRKLYGGDRIEILGNIYLICR